MASVLQCIEGAECTAAEGMGPQETPSGIQPSHSAPLVRESDDDEVTFNRLVESCEPDPAQGAAGGSISVDPKAVEGVVCSSPEHTAPIIQTEGSRGASTNHSVENKALDSGIPSLTMTPPGCGSPRKMDTQQNEKLGSPQGPGGGEHASDILLGNDTTTEGGADSNILSQAAKNTDCSVCHEPAHSLHLCCFECKHRVHFKCSKLPRYQFRILAGSQRRFTCEYCVTRLNFTDPFSDADQDNGLMLSQQPTTSQDQQAEVEKASAPVTDASQAPERETVVTVQRIDELEIKISALVRGLCEDNQNTRMQQATSELKASKAEVQSLKHKIEELKRKVKQAEERALTSQNEAAAVADAQ